MTALISTEALNTISAAMAALSAFALCAITLLALRESHRAEVTRRHQTARAMDHEFQLRLDPLYDGLRSILGHLEDGVPKPIRAVMIPFFVLYSDAFSAHRDGLLDERDWLGLNQELLYWAQKPVAQRAWKAFRQQEWSDGFANYIDQAIVGPPAYPNLREVATFEPLVPWPEEGSVSDEVITEVVAALEKDLEPLLDKPMRQELA